MCPSYRVAVLVFVLITSPESLLGSGKLDIDDQSSQTDSSSGTILDEFFKRIRAKIDSFPTEKTSFPTEKTLPSHISTKIDLHTVVLSRFTKEMEFLFVTLPVSTQCRELLKILETTSCTFSSLQNWTSLRTNISKCNWHRRDERKACSRVIFVKVFQQQMGQVFASLPWPFKCNIVNLVAQTYNVCKGQVGKSQQKISVQDVQNAIVKIFSFIHIEQSCTKVIEEVVLPPVSLVRLRVELNNGMTRETWLKNFETKGPLIYGLYLEYLQSPDKNKHLIGTSIRRPLPPVVPPSKICVEEVSEGTQRFSVIFGLQIKKKEHFRAMKSRHIVNSLKNAKADELNAALQARVQVDLKKEQMAINTSSDVKQWKDLKRAISLFPKSLTDYYKQIGHIERCIIMYQISSSLGRSPVEVEQLYNALNLVIRRYCCYHVNRSGTRKNFIKIGPERETQPTQLPQTHTASKDSDVSYESTPYVGEGQGQNKEPAGESEISSLEYTLFILLGLLCIATLAFTINYALFALRRSPNRTNHRPPNGTNHHLPNGMLPSTAVWKNGRQRVQCVHIMHKSMAMQEQQLTFTTSDSGLPCRRHHAQSQSSMPTLDLVTSVSAADSGYSQETSAPYHGSAIVRDLHSDTGEVCGQNSGNPKSLESETELGSEAKMSNVNTETLPQEPGGHKMRCSSKDSESSCTQSDETVSPEAPCESLHTVVDRDGIKEVQV